MVVVHRKVTFCTVILGVKFLPGMNSISDSEMKEIESTSAFKSEIDCGNMVIGGQFATETMSAVEETDSKIRAAKMAREILSMSAKDAATLVSTINDANILKALKEADGRTGVQSAVDIRIKAIKTQDGSDLKPETRQAPEGSGAEFAGDISGTKEDLSGTKAHTAIPALKQGVRK
jgi:hypothetical protein